MEAEGDGGGYHKMRTHARAASAHTAALETGASASDGQNAKMPTRLPGCFPCCTRRMSETTRSVRWVHSLRERARVSTSFMGASHVISTHSTRCEPWEPAWPADPPRATYIEARPTDTLT